MPSPNNAPIKLVNGELIEQPAGESTPNRNENVKMVKQLLAKALHHHSACRNASRGIANNAVAAGNYLCAIKELNPGQWQRVLEEGVEKELGLSVRTAQRYMQLARSVKLLCAKVRSEDPQFVEYSDEDLLATMSLRTAMRAVGALESDEDDPKKEVTKEEAVAPTTDVELLGSIQSLLQILDFVVTDSLGQEIAPTARFVNIDVAIKTPGMLRGIIHFDLVKAKLPNSTLDDILRLHVAGQIQEAILHLSVTNFVAVSRRLANFCHAHVPPRSSASFKRQATVLVFLASTPRGAEFGSALGNLGTVFVPWHTA
jgi:hypothetical protein